MKYVVHYGYRNSIESNSKNTKQHLINLGGDSVRIETKSGEFVCTATRYADGSISVCTIDN